MDLLPGRSAALTGRYRRTNVVTTVSTVKTAEPIKILIGAETLVSPKKHVLVGGPTGGGGKFGIYSPMKRYTNLGLDKRRALQ